MVEQIVKFFESTGYTNVTFEQLIMILIACFLMYLAIVKQYEPLLLVPISFGMLLANIPIANLMGEGKFLYWIYQGVKLNIYPPLIFLGVGAMTDFGPLIA
ncbi:MAG TPA: sodium ion-translocating decarboxylase subunit beta, partial [Tepidanaerobacteraceae bacterium]|nr:sodium ion-translocating decarboxylase subunit beta [Tepidanaerobacteraceae bacterium]